MKKYFLFLFLIVIVSCSYKITPVKGDYQSTYSFETDKQFNEVWDHLIMYLSAKNIMCDEIDKPSGYIKTGPIDFVKRYKIISTSEDPRDTIHDILLCRMNNMQKYDSLTSPRRLKLRLEIKVVRVNAKTHLDFSLLPYYINYGGFVIKPERPEDMNQNWKDVFKSTGLFEKRLFDQLK